MKTTAGTQDRTAKTHKYQISVFAVGYDTTRTVVEAASLHEARKSEYAAVTSWLQANDADEDTRGLAFVETRLIK